MIDAGRKMVSPHTRAGTMLRSVLRRAIGEALLALAARPKTLRLLNASYCRLGSSAHAWMQPRYGRMFRDGSHRLADGRWTLEFAGREVVLPMRGRSAWLDWDVALSVLGHEPAIKETYRTLLSSGERPELFVDIGGNYGLHSLLFLIAGVETMTFEPNASCHEYFRETCRLNGVEPRLIHAAVGAERGRLVLCFPERETWLGSLDPDVSEQLRSKMSVREEHVDVQRLDEYESMFAGRRALIKIDAEGHELAVLRGAATILAQHRPLILFEVHETARRVLVHELLDRCGYGVVRLPLTPRTALSRLDRAQFYGAPEDDFIAVPTELFDAGRVTYPATLFAREPRPLCEA